MTERSEKHSSRHNEHYTPKHITDMVRQVMGSIDLDPASCVKANEVVGAAHVFGDDAKLGGLAFPWYGSVFLNPPGGKLYRDTLHPLPRSSSGTQGGPGLSAAAVWWEKLEHEWGGNRVNQAIFLAFNMGVFRTTQGRCTPPFSFPMCVPRERIAFDVIGEDGVRRPGKSPPQDSAIIFLPDVPRDERCFGDYESVKRFERVFSGLGAVRC